MKQKFSVLLTYHIDIYKVSIFMIDEMHFYFEVSRTKIIAYKGFRVFIDSEHLKGKRNIITNIRTQIQHNSFKMEIIEVIITNS